jgi:hypothetical protein
MPSLYPVKIKGLENKKIVLESSGFFSPVKILVNGVKAEPGSKNNEVILRKDDGTKVSVFIQNAFFDTVPRLIVNGETLIVTPPLKWYQYVFCGLTLFLIFYGGAIGAVLCMIGFLINIRTMRNSWRTPWKYLVILGTHLIVFVVYIAISLLITVMTTP